MDGNETKQTLNEIRVLFLHCHERLEDSQERSPHQNMGGVQLLECVHQQKYLLSQLWHLLQRLLQGEDIYLKICPEYLRFLLHPWQFYHLLEDERQEIILPHTLGYFFE